MLLQQPAAQRLVERVGGLVLIAPARRPQQVGVEPSAEDRGCGERLRGGLRDAGDPGAEQLAHARRQRPDPVARPGICRPERVDVGREQERQAPGLVDQPPDVDPRARQARRVEQRRRLLGAEGARAGELGVPAPLGGVQRGAQPLRRPRVAFPGEHRQERQLGEPPDEEGQQLRRGVVGPVDVVDHDGAGGAGSAERAGEGVADRVVEAGLRARRVERLGRGQIGAAGREHRHEARQLDEVVRRDPLGEIGAEGRRAAQQLGDEPEREARLALMAPHRDDRRTVLGQPARQLLDDPALPRAGIAGHAHQPAAAAHLAPGVQQQGEDGLLAEQRRTLDDGQPAASLGTARRLLGGRPEPVGAHVLVEGRRRGEGRDAELALEPRARTTGTARAPRTAVPSRRSSGRAPGGPVR